MTSDADQRDLFDRWAQTYDSRVQDSKGFPLGGYSLVLADLLHRSEGQPEMTVLDLGTGTGNLAALFIEIQCSVWALDSSPGMIQRARSKHTGVTFAIADMRDGVPTGFPRQYDRIVSAYAFHHLRLSDKLSLIRDLVAGHLGPEGKLLIADVAFPTAAARDRARARLGGEWEPGEYYWAADETKPRLQELTLAMSYSAVTDYSGVFVIKRS